MAIPASTTIPPRRRPVAERTRCSGRAHRGDHAHRAGTPAPSRRAPHQGLDAVDVYVSYVRGKATRRIIDTVRGRGYRIGTPGRMTDMAKDNGRARLISLRMTIAMAVITVIGGICSLRCVSCLVTGQQRPSVRVRLHLTVRAGMSATSPIEARNVPRAGHRSRSVPVVATGPPA